MDSVELTQFGADTKSKTAAAVNAAGGVSPKNC